MRAQLRIDGVISRAVVSGTSPDMEGDRSSSPSRSSPALTNTPGTTNWDKAFIHGTRAIFIGRIHS